MHKSPICEVWSCSFWMGAIGGTTAKRHRLWSNDQAILGEVSRIGGYLSRSDMLQLPGEPLVRKYVDARGIKRHAGIPDKLKNSQYLGSMKILVGVYVNKIDVTTHWCKMWPPIGTKTYWCETCVQPRHYSLDFGFLIADMFAKTRNDSRLDPEHIQWWKHIPSSCIYGINNWGYVTGTQAWDHGGLEPGWCWNLQRPLHAAGG